MKRTAAGKRRCYSPLIGVPVLIGLFSFVSFGKSYPNDDHARTSNDTYVSMTRVALPAIEESDSASGHVTAEVHIENLTPSVFGHRPDCFRCMVPNRSSSIEVVDIAPKQGPPEVSFVL